MKFVARIIGEIWRIAFLVFFVLLFYSMSGGELTSWAESYLILMLQLLEDWIMVVVPIMLLLAGVTYIKKVGWHTVSKQVTRYFQSNLNEGSDFKERWLSPSKLFFASSIVSVAISLTLFNVELRKSPDCRINLLNETSEECIINSELTKSIRIVVHSGGNESTVNVKVPIDIHFVGDMADISWSNVLPEAASTGGNGRYHSNLNYGIYDLPKNQQTSIHVSATAEVNQFKLFNVKIISNPNNWLMKIFSAMFLVTLFLSIYLREVIFTKGISKILPYFLFCVIALLVIY